MGYLIDLAQEIVMGIILLIPFVIEVIGDAILIRRAKKDIHVALRCFMIVCVAALYGWGSAYEVMRGLILALAPFPLFDQVLNVLRFRSLKAYAYIGKTKFWDRTLQHWKEEFGVKDWMFLSVRILCTALLITLYNVI